MPDTYNCDLCGYPCGNSDKLVKHMQIHANHERWKEQRQRELEQYWLQELERDREWRRKWKQQQRERERERELNREMSIQQEDVFGVPTMTYTQHTEHPNGTTTTVSMVNSSLGATAMVTTAQRPTSQITMTTVSQPSGAFTSLGPEQHDNDCVLCFEPLSDKETRTTLCNHTFHKNCLLELSKKSSTRTRDDFPCPLCRKAITDDWLKS